MTVSSVRKIRNTMGKSCCVAVVLPDVDNAIFEEPYLLSEGSMHFMGEPSSRASGEGSSGRPPTNPVNPPPQLHNYLNDPR